MDKTRLSCVVRVGGVNTTGDKTRQFCFVSIQFPISKFSVILSIYLRLNSCKLETILSCLVASSVHTADTDKTKQDSFVLSVSVV